LDQFTSEFDIPTFPHDDASLTGSNKRQLRPVDMSTIDPQFERLNQMYYEEEEAEDEEGDEDEERDNNEQLEDDSQDFLNESMVNHRPGPYEHENIYL
jgi:hypothetical protein